MNIVCAIGFSDKMCWSESLAYHVFMSYTLGHRIPTFRTLG